MNYSRFMLLSKEVQNWTHLFRMCSQGANTYNCHVRLLRDHLIGDTVNYMFENKRGDFGGDN